MAIKSGPKIRVGAETKEAERKLRRLKAQLTDMKQVRFNS